MSKLSRIGIASGDISAEIVPERGALLASLRVDGRELFYLDESTLNDPAKNVRGGNPVLFPTPGKLTDDHWSRDGREGSLKQHGFARDLPWRIAEQRADALTLALTDDAQTLARFPWRFSATIAFSIRARGIGIDVGVRCIDGPGPMPFGVGFHPYFRVEGDKSAARIDTPAHRAWDNVQKKAVDLALPIALGGGEVDLHLLDHGRTDASLQLPDGARIDVRGDASFTHWVVWTQPGKPFVCLEPWTCPGDALNTGERLITLAPGESKAFSLEYSLAPV